MDTKSVPIFRVLVVATLVSYASTLWLAQREAGPVADLIATVGLGGIVTANAEWLWNWINCGLFSLSLVGLFFFVPIARAGLVVALISAILLSRLGAMAISSPMVAFLFGTHDLLFMLVFGMAFFHPPIRQAFRRAAAHQEKQRSAVGA